MRLLPRRSILTGAAAAVLALGFLVHAGPVAAEPKVGAPAPEFTGTDTFGKTHALSSFRGKTVVLEWTNHDCPFVQKHYGANNMQALQKAAAKDGVVWLTVISSAPGEQGHVSPDKANALTKDRGASPAAVLLDEKGTIGRLYGAKTTPHMYVIDPLGTLVYMGAIDDRPTADKADVAGATNYVAGALAAVAAGKTPNPASTRAYGCSVKYGS